MYGDQNSFELCDILHSLIAFVHEHSECSCSEKVACYTVVKNMRASPRSVRVHGGVYENKVKTKIFNTYF